MSKFTHSRSSSQMVQQKCNVSYSKTLQPFSNLFELENTKLYINFSFFCLMSFSLIYLVFASFSLYGYHLPLI